MEKTLSHGTLREVSLIKLLIITFGLPFIAALVAALVPDNPPMTETEPARSVRVAVNMRR